LYPLNSLHTFGLNNSANALQQLSSLEQVCQFAKQQSAEPYWILGEGSNTIFTEDFMGTLLQIKIAGVQLTETADAYMLKVGAGENWHQLVNWCLARDICGFENLALIPGTVGAVPIQNIGAYGIEIERFVHSVEYVCLNSGQLSSLSGEECGFAYRDSVFKNELSGQVIITQVVFSLPKQWQAVVHYGELANLISPSAMDIFNKVVAVRQSKLPDPKIIGNAGSFFKNPTVTQAALENLLSRFPDMPHYPGEQGQAKLAAAWLIDKLGFKGAHLGGIGCHSQQALVLTNNGQGRGDELLALARQIKQRVREEFSIALMNEVRLVGSKGLIEL
jgi:UDP-N-acetylmuramate dehydrogenase